MKPTKKQILRHIGAFKSEFNPGWILPEWYNVPTLRELIFKHRNEVTKGIGKVTEDMNELRLDSELSADVEDNFLMRIRVLEHRMNKASMFFAKLLEALGMEWEIKPPQKGTISLKKKRSKGNVKKKRSS